LQPPRREFGFMSVEGQPSKPVVSFPAIPVDHLPLIPLPAVALTRPASRRCTAKGAGETPRRVLSLVNRAAGRSKV
jgi:hypothetical protein